MVGCYKLLASLRCLAEWVMTTFKEWLELKVLQPNAVSRQCEGGVELGGASEETKAHETRKEGNMHWTVSRG